jgi:hypothetical protein
MPTLPIGSSPKVLIPMPKSAATMLLFKMTIIPVFAEIGANTGRLVPTAPNGGESSWISELTNPSSPEYLSTK